jgi:DNA ligase-1
MRHSALSLCCTLILTSVPAFSLATLPTLQLAMVYQPQEDISSFWISEKLDGVRAFWDGKQLRSRSGQWIALPATLMQQLPPFAVEAELWAGRGKFQQVMQALQHKRENNWQEVKLMVFDAPEQPGTFSERLQFLQQQLTETSFVQLIPQQRLQTTEELQQLLEQVTAAGGEGLMLHQAQALYQSGRVSHLQKLKAVQDAEARVVAHLPGKGKLKGMLGALLVELPDGRRFKLGSGFTEQERKNPPPVGALVTFEYQGLTHKGTPRFAVFARERTEP